MKKFMLLLGLLIALASCNTDKKTKLEQLKKQRDQITEQIKNLEIELKEDPNTATGKVIFVNIEDLKKQSFKHYIEVQGKVDGEENVGVSAKTAGVVNEIFVKQGDVVKRGQILAQLDNQIMKLSIKELEEQSKFVTDVYNKQKSLWDQKIGSEIQYLTAKNNKEALDNKLKTLKEQLEMSEVRSPIDGTIEEIPIKIGQMVSPGITIFRVVNFSKVKVLAELAESYSAKVKKGSEVLIKFPDFNEDIVAKVDFASRYITPVNRTFQVECRLAASKDIEFRANMIAVLKINDYSKDSALVVPINAVQNSQIGKYVFVAEMVDGKNVAKKKAVKVGNSSSLKVEILEGLSVGDKVITNGYQNLEEGQMIKF